MERSIFWATEGIGDGRSEGYNQDDVTQWQQMLWNQDPTTEGYASGYLNEVEITNPAGTTVRMASGGAVVYGFAYRNTSNVDFVPFTPTLGNTGWRVVLRTDWVLRTVRGVLLQSADGVAAYPAVTQNAGYRWEISLARGTITNLGAVTVDFDDRTSVGSGGRWTVTPDDIQDRTRSFLVQAVGECDTVQANGADRNRYMNPGWTLMDGLLEILLGGFVVPRDFASGLTVAAICEFLAAGNAFVDNEYWHGHLGETYATHNANPGYAAVAVGANVQVAVVTQNLPNVEIGEFVELRFRRDAVNVLDTVNTTGYFMGWLVTYTADS